MFLLKEKDYKKLRQILKKSNVAFKQYIIDTFGNQLSTTFWNMLMGFISWLLYLIPLVITIVVIFYFKDYRIIDFTLKFIKFLVGWIIFFVILIPIATLLNEFRLRHVYYKKRTYNIRRLDLRKNWLHHYFARKFGTNLHSSKTYSVENDNNIPINYIIKHYKYMRKMNRN